MGGTVLPTAIATVLAAIISAGIAWLTNRAARRAEARNAANLSRTDIEKGAFERAQEFYTDTIERQDREIRDCHAEGQALKRQVTALTRRVGELEDDLATAQRALRLRHPDE